MSALTAASLPGWAGAALLAAALARGRRAARRRAARRARVTHELRGPLHAAGLIVASLGRDGSGPPALGALQVELARVAVAVADLDDGGRTVRRGGRGAAAGVPPGPCDVAALVRTLAPGWQAQAQAAGIGLGVHVPPSPLWVRGERVRLAQALGNLVANALEHGAGPVGVRVRCGGAREVHVEVSDHGPGLPAAVATLAARSAHGAARRGHGLGIAARIAEAAGGRLSAAPAGRGARVVLALARTVAS